MVTITAQIGARSRPTSTKVATPASAEAIVGFTPLARRAAVPKMRPAATDPPPVMAA